MATTKSEEADEHLWYLNTRCTNHMSGKKEWFIDLDELVKRKLRFIDDSMVTVEGIVRVKIHRKDGNESCVSEVLYVPTMKSNLCHENR